MMICYLRSTKPNCNNMINATQGNSCNMHASHAVTNKQMLWTAKICTGTNKRRTRKDRATQPLDVGRPSFAIRSLNLAFLYFPCSFILLLYFCSTNEESFDNNKALAGLRLAGPSGIVGRVHLSRVHFSRLASRLRRSARSEKHNFSYV